MVKLHFQELNLYLHLLLRGSRHNAVDMTRYGLEGLGIESRWGTDFPHPSRPALKPTQLPI